MPERIQKGIPKGPYKPRTTTTAMLDAARSRKNNYPKRRAAPQQLREKQRPGDLDRLAARIYRERLERGEIRRPAPVPVDTAAQEAIARYHTEKAMSAERNAAKRAEQMQRVKDALERADAAAADAKTVKKRLRALKTDRWLA